ncbi:hypothetical protein M144_1739 [Bacteroides fragilis str. 3-F-2 |nr:hypothetical protein M144_1739 [Bacteroides fragilis str. 3-F-2 \
MRPYSLASLFQPCREKPTVRGRLADNPNPAVRIQNVRFPAVR